MQLSKKINVIGIIILLIIFSLMTGCSTNGKINKGTDTLKEIRFGYQASPNGELLAKALGLMEKKYPNINIKWIKFDAGRDVNNAMASGSIDFGLVGTPPGAIGVANKLPYKIYYLHDIIGESEALIAKKNSGINSLQDLKGKKVATTFSSTSHYSLLRGLQKEHINFEKKGTKIVDMQASDIYAAWQRNDIDAAYIWQPIQTQLLNDGGKVITNSKELAKKGVITGEFGIVNKEFAAKHSNIVKGYISVLNKAVHYYREKPEQSAKLLSKELELSPEQTLKAMRQIIWLDASKQKEYFGKTGQPGKLARILKDTGDFLATQKDIKTSPSLDIYQQSLLNGLYK